MWFHTLWVRSISQLIQGLPGWTTPLPPSISSVVRGGGGWAWLKGCSPRKEIVSAAFCKDLGSCCGSFSLWMNNPDYTESEDLCPSWKPTRFSPPPVSRLWTRLFQAGVVADINGLFPGILDNHRPGCQQTSSHLRAARPLLDSEHLSLSLTSVSCGQLWPPAAVTPGNGKSASCAAWAADTSQLLPLL